MNKKTRKATEESLAKWRANEVITDINDTNLGPLECPLCILFNKGIHGCVGCPIAEKANRSGCYNTPYYDAVDVYWDNDPSAFKHHAKLMADFIEELL